MKEDNSKRAHKLLTQLTHALLMCAVCKSFELTWVNAIKPVGAWSATLEPVQPLVHGCIQIGPSHHQCMAAFKPGKSNSPDTYYYTVQATFIKQNQTIVLVRMFLCCSVIMNSEFMEYTCIGRLGWQLCPVVMHIYNTRHTSRTQGFTTPLHSLLSWKTQLVHC